MALEGTLTFLLFLTTSFQPASVVGVLMVPAPAAPDFVLASFFSLFASVKTSDLLLAALFPRDFLLGACSIKPVSRR